MKRNVKIGRWKLFVILALLLAMIACDPKTDEDEKDNTSQQSTTKLQDLVNGSTAGTTIDLSKYPDITDYSANISTSLTLSNSPDGKSLDLGINVTDVTLDNISGDINVLDGIGSGKLTIKDSTINNLMVLGGSNCTIELKGTTTVVNSNIGKDCKIDADNVNKISSLGVDASVNVELAGCEVDTVKLKGAEGSITIGTSTLEIGAFETDVAATVYVPADFVQSTLPTHDLVTVKIITQVTGTGAGNMVRIEGGTFNNGTADVTLSDFYMGETEVTQGQWKAVMGTTTPSGSDSFDYGAGDNYPLYYVSWYDAVEFCNALSANEGFTKVYYTDSTFKIPADNLNNEGDVYADWTKDGYRLPTEAEWEYAAGGGAAPSGGRTTYAGTSDESKLGEYAWYEGNNDDDRTKVVKTTIQPNQLKLYDMTGNVWEWCWDWYDGSYSSDAQENPRGPSTSSDGLGRVLRGGGWSYSSSYCKVEFRYSNNPSYRVNNLGFRVARSSD